MATVPNWIAKAVIYESRDYGRTATVTDILSWRATKTQVIVTVQTPAGRSERRFRLDGLAEVGVGRGAWDSRFAKLMDSDDEKVIKARADQRVRATIGTLRRALDERLDLSSMDDEALTLAIGRIQRAATKALAEMADLL